MRAWCSISGEWLTSESNFLVSVSSSLLISSSLSMEPSQSVSSTRTVNITANHHCSLSLSLSLSVCVSQEGCTSILQISLETLSYWLLCLGLFPAGCTAQQHSIIEEHVKKTHNNQSINDKITERKTPVTVLTANIRATFTTNSSSDFYYNRVLLMGKPSAHHIPRLQFHVVIVGLDIHRQ